MSGSRSRRNHRREARRRAEDPKEFHSRASPKRVGRAFALLTRTYHGGRLDGSYPETAFEEAGNVLEPDFGPRAVADRPSFSEWHVCRAPGEQVAAPTVAYVAEL